MTGDNSNIFDNSAPDQLSGLDSVFLHAESARTPMHIGGCAIYDPSTAPNGHVRLKDILGFIDARTHRAKTFYQKLKQVPMDFDCAYWVDDPDFDIEFHISHIALPKPGDWRQLCIQAARIHSRQLDLSKPLWEFTVIEGLGNIPNIPKGAYAIASRIHHCAIDGATGIKISEAIHSLEPEDEIGPDEPPRQRARDISDFEIIARANINSMMKPLQSLMHVSHVVPGALKYAAGLEPRERALLDGKVPRTRFNGVISGHRVFDAIEISLASVKKIRQLVPGSTVNDVVLTIIGGALHSYLSSKSELPEDSLIAMAPLSVRNEGDVSGNSVSALRISLGTHIADPVERLRHTHEHAASSKAMSNALGAREMSEIAKHSPTMISGISTRLYSRLGLANQLSPMFNTTITNVPGPQVPLYMAGARMTHNFGLGPIMDSSGLFHSIISYCGSITLAVTACRKMMPDPAFYKECLQQSFDEILEKVPKPKDAKPDARKPKDAKPEAHKSDPKPKASKPKAPKPKDAKPEARKSDPKPKAPKPKASKPKAPKPRETPSKASKRTTGRTSSKATAKRSKNQEK